MEKKNKSVLYFHSILFRCFFFVCSDQFSKVKEVDTYINCLGLHVPTASLIFQPRGAGRYLHSNGCVENKEPKTKTGDRRPKAHMSKTKNHWSKAKTHWSKTKTQRSKTSCLQEKIMHTCECMQAKLFSFL